MRHATSAGGRKMAVNVAVIEIHFMYIQNFALIFSGHRGRTVFSSLRMGI